MFKNLSKFYMDGLKQLYFDIKNANRKNHIMKESKYRKMDNMKINNEEIYEDPIAERKKKVINKE